MPRRPSATKAAVFLACLLPIAYLTWRAVTDRLGADPIREIQIETGLWTLRFLAATLTITPLRRLTGWNALAKYRRTLGLFTFFYASVHLAWWVGVDWFFDFGAMWEEIVKHKYILVGMATFLLMGPLAATSTKGWIRRLGRKWQTLHRLIYLSAIAAAVHYIWKVKVVFGAPVYYAAIVGALLLIRLLLALGRRRADVRPSSATSPIHPA